MFLRYSKIYLKAFQLKTGYLDNFIFIQYLISTFVNKIDLNKKKICVLYVLFEFIKV